MMTRSARCSEAILVGYGVVYWSVVGLPGLLALLGAVAGAVGVYLNGSWRWSARLRMAGILAQLLVLWGEVIGSFGQPEFAAFMAVMVLGVIALKRAARHDAEYMRAAWTLSH